MLLERPMKGSFENDWPQGDYCGVCIECGSEYHGRLYQLACYKCVNEGETLSQLEKRNQLLGGIIQILTFGTLFYFYSTWSSIL